MTRWDPLRDLLALHEHIGQLVGTDAPGWQPPADLSEHPDRFTLSIEVPGLSRDQIDIHVEEHRVVVRGERPAGQVSCDHYVRVERGHGRFQRTFTVPEALAVDRVSAQLSDGILTVVLPKLAEPGTRTIRVTS